MLRLLSADLLHQNLKQTDEEENESSDLPNSEWKAGATPGGFLLPSEYLIQTSPINLGSKFSNCATVLLATVATSNFTQEKKTCSAQGATFDIVDRLTSPYYGCGRTLYVDNYYTSPDQFRHLHAEGTLACGTMHLNRKNVPPKRMFP